MYKHITEKYALIYLKNIIYASEFLLGNLSTSAGSCSKILCGTMLLIYLVCLLNKFLKNF